MQLEYQPRKWNKSAPDVWCKQHFATVTDESRIIIKARAFWSFFLGVPNIICVELFLVRIGAGMDLSETPTKYNRS